MQYIIIGCLGSVVGSVSTIPDAVQIVQAQLPISTKTAAALANKLERAKPGQEVDADYGGSGCTVRLVAASGAGGMVAEG